MPVKRIGHIIAERSRSGYRLRPDIPVDMSLDLSSACNQACIFCPNPKQTKPIRTMPLSEAVRIMEEAHELGVHQVGLYSTGEPFLISNFDQYVAAARKIGYEYIYVTTNGSLLNISKLHRVLDAGLNSLKFSINAFGRSEYRFIHGRDHSCVVMENLEHAIRLKEKYDFRLYVSCVTTDYSPNAFSEIESRFGQKVDEVLHIPCSFFNGLVPENFGALTLEKVPKEAPCYLPFQRLCVTPEGYLNACCGDYQNYLAVADLHHTSIEEAWYAEKLIQLRQKHLENDLSGTLCHRCINKDDEAYGPLVGSLYSPIPDDYYRQDRLRREIEKRLGHQEQQ